MRYDKAEVPNKLDFRAFIGNRVPFMSKNLSTLIEIRRQQQKNSIEGLLGKDESYKGVAFVDDSFKVLMVQTNGTMSIAGGGGLFLRGENFTVINKSVQIDDFNGSLKKFSIYLNIEVEEYRDENDDSPVPGLEETVSRHRVKYTFTQEPGEGGQPKIKWNSDKDLNPAKIWLCDIKDFDTVKTIIDKRYFSGIPYLNLRNLNNLSTILEELKYTDEDGITERTILTKEVPQIPAAITTINKSITKIGSNSLDTIKDNIYIQNGYKEVANSLEYDIFNLTHLVNLAIEIGKNNFPNEIGRIEGVQEIDDENILEDSTKDFIALGVQVDDLVFNITTQSSATVIYVETTQLKLSKDIFSKSDIYSIPTGQISIGLEQLYANKVVDYLVWQDLKDIDTLQRFIEIIGGSNLEGIRKDKTDELRIANDEIIAMGKVISESVDTTEDPSRYRLKLWWDEPITQESGLPLTQNIVSYILKVSEVNALTEGEVSELNATTQINEPILKAKGLTNETVELLSKYKSINSVGREIYVTIPEGRNYTFRARGDEKYIVYIAPVTEYDILGKWKAIYIDMNDEAVGGKPLKQDIQEEVQIYKQKEAIAIQSHVAAIKRTRSDLDRAVYSYSVLASKPNPLVITESMLRSTVPDIPETWRVDYRSIIIKLWVNDGSSYNDNHDSLENSYCVVSKSPSYVAEYLESITVNPNADLLVTIHFSFISTETSIDTTESLK